MNFLILILFTFFSLNSQAFFERKISGVASNHPAGGVLNLGLAFNYKMWDDSEKNFWNYGYIRPKISYDTSILVNTVGAELQLYPISIFGISFGTNYGSRSVQNNEDFNCEQINCKGDLQRDYYRLNASIGFGDVISSLSFQSERLSPRNDQGLTSLDFSTLLLLPSGQTSTQEKTIAFMGYKLSDDFQIGLLEMFHKISAGNWETHKSEGQYFVGSLRHNEFKYMAGLGTFGSDYNEKTFALIVKINWLLDPSLSLND